MMRRPGRLRRVVKLPALLVAIFRQRRRVADGRLRVARTGATLRSEYRDMKRLVFSSRGMIAFAGLGLAVGLLGRPRANAGRARLLRSAATLLPLIASFRRLAPDEGHPPAPTDSGRR